VSKINYPEQIENLVLLMLMCQGAQHWLPVWQLEQTLATILQEDRGGAVPEKEECELLVDAALRTLERDKYVKGLGCEVRLTPQGSMRCARMLAREMLRGAQ